MFLADGWKDFQILDATCGERLERWGDYILVRPDPQVIWKTKKVKSEWKSPNGRYIRSASGGGNWEQKNLPESWKIKYRDLTFRIKPMGFKHTGVFPEQAYNWDYCREIIEKHVKNRTINVLNLFAYSGGATISAAAAGAAVCHVDASKGMVATAKENAKLSGLESANIRYIVDDCKKFVEREIRRGKKYDAIIMDPPSYGRGPTGELWKLEDEIYDFVKLCTGVLSDEPIFMLINSYTTGLSPSVMSYILGATMKEKFQGETFADELGLPVKDSDPLPCGASAYWIAK